MSIPFPVDNGNVACTHAGMLYAGSTTFMEGYQMTAAGTGVRYGLTAKIAPGIELNTIVIKLDRFGAPVVELRGQIMTGRPRMDRASSAIIQTAHLGPAGRAFIEELKGQFSREAAPAHEPGREDVEEAVSSSDR